MEKSESLENLIQFVVDSVQQAQADDAPFHHLRFDRIFPDDFYAQMVDAMPVTDDYRAMSGKSKAGSSRPPRVMGKNQSQRRAMAATASAANTPTGSSTA